MKYSILIILITCNMVHSLNGSSGSICYEYVRVGKPLAIGPGVTKTIYDKQPQKKCCPGYYEFNDECQPICDPPCVFGDCIAQNVCKCHQYYIEPLCDEAMCPAGYKGLYCDENCSRDTYGPNCQMTCTCQNGDCDSETGECKCHEGWHGPTCSECECFNNGVCDSWSGICECPSGYTGKRCENECVDGSWGLNCLQSCNCTNYSCNAITGKCENDCTHGQYVNDTCVCDYGWAGETCDIQCICQNGECNSSGHCECEPGWRGETCNEMCEEGYYGPGCSIICTLTGLGNFICDPIKGTVCKPGYSGTHCTDLCPEWTYGSGCERCSCVNASRCNKFTGECECHPGWYGSKCDIPCPEGTYGIKCEHECLCPKCRASDGFCPCQEGWNGTYCQEFCPPERFNVITNRCVEISYARIIQIDANTLVIASTLIFVVLLALCVSIVMIVCFRKAKKNRRAREYQRRYGPLLYERVERPQSHIYEEIPEGNVYDQYNQLVHIPVEEGYLPPKEVPPLVQNKLYSQSVENGYVSPKSLRRSYIITRNTLPEACKGNLWRQYKVKSSI